MAQMIKKLRKSKDFIIPYIDKKGQKKVRVLYNEGFKRKTAKDYAQCDNIPNTNISPYPSLVERLKAERCELYGAEGKTVMHHVRTLKDLKVENEWEQQMLKKHRKTLAVLKPVMLKFMLTKMRKTNGELYTRRLVRTVRGQALGNLPSQDGKAPSAEPTIYQYLDCKKPFERLWISSLMDKAIRKGLSNLKPGSHYDNLYYSAKSRSDWLVGINASRGLSIVRKGSYSLGRVQTPTSDLLQSYQKSDVWCVLSDTHSSVHRSPSQ